MKISVLNEIELTQTSAFKIPIFMFENNGAYGTDDNPNIASGYFYVGYNNSEDNTISLPFRNYNNIPFSNFSGYKSIIDSLLSGLTAYGHTSGSQVYTSASGESFTISRTSSSGRYETMIYFIKDGATYILLDIYSTQRDTLTLSASSNYQQKIGGFVNIDGTANFLTQWRAGNTLNYSFIYLQIYPGLNDGSQWYYIGTSYLPSSTSLNGITNVQTAAENIQTSSLVLIDYLKPKLPTAWPGPNSDTGGAGGDFDDTSDPIPVPPLPATSVAVNSNFITMYNPTMAELTQVASVLWSNTLTDAIRQLFADPVNAIISLHLTPFPISVAATASTWYIGLVTSGVDMKKVTSQYVEYDFGTLSLREYWGNSLDYSPYTKAQIYLPYIGLKDLDIDDIQNSDINLRYHVDILTGTCTAYVIVTKQDERSPLNGQASVLYQFNGNCNLQIPVTGADYSNLVRNIINLAGQAASSTLAGGLVTNAGVEDVAKSVASGAMQSAQAIMGAKPTIQHAGQAGGVAGALSVQSAYIYLSRPAQSLPEDYNTLHGYPSNITATLGDLQGFTMVDKIHVNITGATVEEKREIGELLKGGVIL